MWTTDPEAACYMGMCLPDTACPMGCPVPPSIPPCMMSATWLCPPCEPTLSQGRQPGSTHSDGGELCMHTGCKTGRGGRPGNPASPLQPRAACSVPPASLTASTISLLAAQASHLQYRKLPYLTHVQPAPGCCSRHN